MSVTECNVQLYILQLQGFEEPGKPPIRVSVITHQ